MTYYLTNWVLLANIRMLRMAIWIADYQQIMLASMNCPRSQPVDDAKAEHERELALLEIN